MQSAATSEELQNAFESHLEQTEEHAARLEEIFQVLEEKPQGKKCDAMEGLVSEGKTIVEETEEGTANRDVGLVMAAQKIEHHEIALYGSLAQLAKTLGRDDIAEILESTLTQENETDKLLTGIAEGSVNYEARSEKS